MAGFARFNWRARIETSHALISTRSLGGFARFNWRARIETPSATPPTTSSAGFARFNWRARIETRLKTWTLRYLGDSPALIGGRGLKLVLVRHQGHQHMIRPL